jgi:hypothetical protein
MGALRPLTGLEEASHIHWVRHCLEYINVRAWGDLMCWRNAPEVWPRVQPRTIQAVRLGH